MGTVDYLSPEIVREKEYSYKTDVWAVGVMLWEMVFGEGFLGRGGGKESDKYAELINVWCGLCRWMWRGLIIGGARGSWRGFLGGYLRKKGRGQRRRSC